MDVQAGEEEGVAKRQAAALLRAAQPGTYVRLALPSYTSPGAGRKERGRSDGRNSIPSSISFLAVRASVSRLTVIFPKASSLSESEEKGSYFAR